MQQTSHYSCAYFKINRFDELNSTKIRRLPVFYHSVLLHLLYDTEVMWRKTIKYTFSYGLY